MSEIVPVTREEKLVDAIIDSEVIADKGVTRAEKYLEHIMKGTTATEEPVTRAEHYLAKIAGMDVQLEEPVTRVEIYLAAIAGMTVDLPAPVTRLEKLLAEWAEAAAGEEKTVTGAVIAISDALRRPAIDYTTTITPVQDLHGYDKPWVGGGGENLLPIDNVLTEGDTYSMYGITMKYSKGYVRVTGTNSTENWVNWNFRDVWYNNRYLFGGGTYSIPSNLTISASVDGSATDLNYGNQIVATDSVSVRGFYIAVAPNQTADWNIPMMFVKGSTRPTTYSPYSNICPITGHEAVNVTRTGKNLMPNVKAQMTSTTVMLGQGNVVAYPIHLKANQPYTISFTAPQYTRAYFKYDGGSNTSWGYSGSSYTPTEDMDVMIWVYLADGISVDDITNIQFELGSTATAYTPYVGDTYDVEFPAEAGTVYGGQLDVTTGVLTVDRAKITYDGSENGWYEYGSGTDHVSAAITVDGKAVGWQKSICDKFKNENGAYNQTPYGCYSDHPTLTNTFFRMPDASVTTVAEFKTWLGSNHTTLVYELAEPTTYQITPTEIHMLLGDNTVWADTGDSTLQYWAEE